MNENLDTLEAELKSETEKLNESKKHKEKLSKEAMILREKLKEEKMRQKQEMQKIKQKIRDDIRKAESYFAFLMLRCIENSNDSTQEQIANILYEYIIKLHENNKKEINRAKGHTETMKFSNKKLYLKLFNLLESQNRQS